MPRFFEVSYPAAVPDGATRRITTKTFQIEAVSERAAVDDAKAIMRDKNIEPLGPPAVKEIEPLEWGRASRA